MILFLVAALLGAASDVKGRPDILNVQSSNVGRIIGGEECAPHSQPWQVAIYYFDIFICGGILINEMWVLTAAHCNVTNYQICLGEHNRQVFEKTEQWRHAVKKCPHRWYNTTTYNKDIMLLKLNSPAVINDYVKIIPLPTEPVADNTNCIISGWGSTSSPEATYSDVLLCLNVTTVPSDVCQGFYDDAPITKNMMCAGNLEGGEDSCEGDSGGPLSCDSILQGITSWGDPICAQPNKPGVYTKVFNFIKWIRNVIENEPPDICFEISN
ncbi:serine protease 1-like [Pyxicephalus adspersus]|uniref:serine protease 1-like n=1 Tax=Pyxicephalus adspersus TaxID=30357 RepID=UPI003B5A4AFC